MNSTEQDRPKTRIRLILYVLASVLTTLLAGLQLPMFGDGTLSWPEFRFAWTVLFLKICADVVITTRAFIDRTPSEEKAEQLAESYRNQAL